MRKIVVALALVLAGCARSAVDPGPLLDELQDTLVEEGYLAHQVGYDTITGEKVFVRAVLDSDKPAVVDAGWGPAVMRVAEIVWTTFPAEVDSVKVTIELGGERTISADRLTEEFGERPDGLVEEDFPVVWVVVVVVVPVGVAALVWWRRRSATTGDRDALASPRD